MHVVYVLIFGSYLKWWVLARPARSILWRDNEMPTQPSSTPTTAKINGWTPDAKSYSLWLHLLYAVKAQTSLAPLSWFPGSHIPTAHVHPGGGGGTHVYWQYRYVRPLRPPFHALPAVPKHIFFIARRSKAYLFHWPTRSYGTQLKSQFSRPPFHVKSQFPRPQFGEGRLVL